MSTDPLNNATGVALNKAVSVTFNGAMDPLTMSTSTFGLTQGVTVVAGTVAYTGTKATFTPAASLVAGKIYTATITTGAKDIAGNAMTSKYLFNFTTTGGTVVDLTAPTISLTDPLNNATAVAVTKAVAVTFSEAMNPLTINASTFTLTQGTTVVAGIVSYAGTKATFTPSASLVAGKIYTVTITTGASDVAGNLLKSNYLLNFTTATAVIVDVTAPVVGTLVPASSATAVAVNSHVTASFSEAMNATTINASTFTLQQGTTAVAGNVTYSGTTATFTPSAALAGSTVYAATITTGAKDLAGNAVAVSKTWSFTTVVVTVVCGSGTQSFATAVLPIVQAKCTPCHGASGASAGISLTNYAQVKAIGARLDNPGMYSKMSTDACQIAIIKAWIAQGSLNN